MFTSEELISYSSTPRFKAFLTNLSKKVVEHRFGRETNELPREMNHELIYFSSAVLGSVANLKGKDNEEWTNLCQKAADIEFALFATRNSTMQETRDEHLRRAAVLYELANLPGTAAAVVNIGSFSEVFTSYLSRSKESIFGKFTFRDVSTKVTTDINHIDVAFRGLDEILNLLGKYLQTFNDTSVENAFHGARVLQQTASNYNLALTADESMAILRTINKRKESSIARFVPKEDLKNIGEAGVPVELWPVQKLAIEGGLLNQNFKSWGLASPTGTGKTSITKILLIDFFNKNPGKKAFYLVPSRALAAEVARELANALKPLGLKVGALGSHLTFHEQVVGDPTDMDLLVFTPEKADLILRIEPELLKDTRLVIVDEAHHIEAGTRGILLEFYLWRLRTLIPSACRIIQLSAVAPNINDLVDWLGDKDTSTSVKVDWRTGRLRMGVYERTQEGSGDITYNDGMSLTLFDNNSVSTVTEESLAQLADRVSESGIVLVLASSKSRAESIARSIVDLRKEREEYRNSPHKGYSFERLDARLERELYDNVPLRELVLFGVAYHHGGLPGRIRTAVEQVIAEKKINVVCATTTLAEGVNFPFSTVIVESLIIGKSTPLSPRELWNIAGRAGRFGVDYEGQCILFQPSIWKSKLSEYKLEDYLQTKLDSIPPVRSALVNALQETYDSIREGKLTIGDIESLSLASIKSKLGNKGKSIRGMVNMVRVGLTHAHVNQMINVEDESFTPTIEKLFAAKQIDANLKKMAKEVEKSQRKVIVNSLTNDDQLLNIAARIGWTLESQANLWQWIRSLIDWKITSFGNIVLSGEIQDPDKLRYLLYPVASLMSEFEGDILGGWTSYIARFWIEGLPLSKIRDFSTKPGTKPRDYDSLIDSIYSKIQYLLPWALYGVNELFKYEATNRNILYASGVRDLSLLSSEGVPNFDALSLVLKLDIERVDATRIASSYQKHSRRKSGIIEWFGDQKWPTIAGIVTGFDKRRIDPDLKAIHEKVKSDWV